MRKLVMKLQAIILISAVLLGGLSVSLPAEAQGIQGAITAIQERAEDIQLTFQDELLKSAKKDHHDLSDLMPLMAFLMVINIFSCLYKNGPDKMLIEMAKMAVWAFVAACIMGGSFYRSTGIGNMFTLNKSICGRTFEHVGGSSLDRDVLNYFKYTTDELACGLYKQDVTRRYNQSVTDMFTIITTVMTFPEECKGTLAASVNGSSSDSVLTCIRNKRKAEEAKKDNVCTGTGWFSISCILTQMYDTVKDVFTGKFIISLIVLILQVLVQIIQFIVLFAVVIGVTGSLLMLKLIAPFLVLESVRGRVLSACKVPLAIALYGFTHKTLLFFLANLMDAITDASLVSFAKFGSKAALDGVIYVYLVIAFASIAMLTMQIVAIMRVPRISMMLVNLSLQELVNIGGEMMKAAFGMTMAVAGGVVGGAALMATGGVSALAGAARGAAGNAMGRFAPAALRPGAGSGINNQMVQRGGRARFPGMGPNAAAPGPQVGSPMAPNGTASAPTVTPPAPPAPNQQTQKNSAIPMRNDLNAANATGGNPGASRGGPTNVTGSSVTVQGAPVYVVGPVTQGGGSAGPLQGLSGSGGGPVVQPAGTATQSADGANNPVSSTPDDPALATSGNGGGINIPPTSGVTSGVAGPSSGSSSSAGGVAGGGTSQGRNSRSRKGGSTSSDSVRDEALSRSNTFEEYQDTKARFDKSDSPDMKEQKSREDKFYGTFGSKQGRRDLGNAIAKGGAGFVKEILMSSMDGPSGSINVTGAANAASMPVKKAFEDGEKRYSEFRESIESEERKRNSQSEAGLEAANQSEGYKNTVLNQQEFNDLMTDLDGIIAGAADDTTVANVLRKVEAGIHGPSAADDQKLQQKHQQAVTANSKYRESQSELQSNSEQFITVIEHMVQKAELTNNDVKHLMNTLALPVDSAALDVYSANKVELEKKMRAQLLEETNVKVKR